MPRVVYSCPFVPAEWIAAHGLTPSRPIPSSQCKTAVIKAVAGVCPYMRAFVNEACAGADTLGIILASTCDQMRRAKDHVETWSAIPVFLMNIPSTWQMPVALDIYLSELERLGSFLVQLGGKPPSRKALCAVMTEYDKRRASARSRREKTGPKTTGIPLALVGGPLTVQDLRLLDVIEQSGGIIVLDATENGERILPLPFDRLRMQADPVGELARTYFESIPDVFQRPNSRLYEWLGKEIRRAGARSVILLRQVWCDKWHAEVARLREALDVPLLDLDLDGEEMQTRHRMRIQAFLEEPA
jgi:benzoyl-CoA reductase/2-hydroxyglutaryl-CoA dehydratase subunit BcrC/BadD/HgdB